MKGCIRKTFVIGKTHSFCKIFARKSELVKVIEGKNKKTVAIANLKP